MSFNVYRVSYAGLPRDHHTIFVEKNHGQSGHVFQATEDIPNGMKHEDKPAKSPKIQQPIKAKNLFALLPQPISPVSSQLVKAFHRLKSSSRALGGSTQKNPFAAVRNGPMKPYKLWSMQES